MAAPPESFLLNGPTGPVHDVLVTGEVDRARRWGATLAAKTGAAPGASPGVAGPPLGAALRVPRRRLRHARRRSRYATLRRAYRTIRVNGMRISRKT